MFRYLIIAVTLISIFYSSFTIAQTIANPDSALEVILAGHKGTRLSLKEAIEQAVSNAASVRSAEAVYLAARGSVRRESGFFDPQFYFNAGYVDQDAPTASFFSGAPILVTQQTNYRSGLRLNLPIGTELDLSINAIKLKTNSQFAFLNPEYNTFGSLSFRQSLLGGFTASARENLSRAEHDLQSRKLLYDQQVLTVSYDVESMYWDLYAVQRNFAVQELTRNQAEALLKETELRAASGLVGPNQVATARTFLAQQELLLLDREEQFTSHSDQLASFLGIRPGEGMQRYIAIDEPPKEIFVEDAELLVEMAVKNNLALQSVQEDIEAARVQMKSAKWKSLPTLDLTGSFSGSGLAGIPRDIIFLDDTLRSTRSGSFSNAVSQVTRREFPGWNIGIELNVPIGLRSGLGERDRLEAEVSNAQQRFVQTSRDLENQVRFAWRELINGKHRNEVALEGVKAAQEQVRIGLIEFRNGRTTAFELVRLGADFAAAQQRYSEALVRTAKAAALLRQLTSGKYSGINQ